MVANLDHGLRPARIGGAKYGRQRSGSGFRYVKRKKHFIFPYCPDNRQQGCFRVIIDSTLVFRIFRCRYQKHMKEVFMFMKLMDIVSIVADKGIHLLVAD
jgi:hypothetical protein